MRLRSPCEHDRYDDHSVYVTGFPAVDCPGGEFLPEDALVIEPSDVESVQTLAQWLFDHGLEEHDCAAYTETQLVLRASDNARLKCEWVAADQVGEPG